MAYLPLGGTDTIKGIMEIEAGSPILAGIAAANLSVNCLKQRQGSEQDHRTFSRQQRKACFGAGPRVKVHFTPSQGRVLLQTLNQLLKFFFKSTVMEKSTLVEKTECFTWSVLCIFLYYGMRHKARRYSTYLWESIVHLRNRCWWTRVKISDWE